MTPAGSACQAEAVLQFWFVACKPRQWFRRSRSFDALVQERFGELTAEAVAGGLSSWEGQQQGALALVLLLDQFSRQVWRDQAQAFSGDARALALSQRALKLGWIEAEPARVRRQFWLMPHLHSENLAVVEASVALFERYSDSATAAVARRHADWLRHFGRYPHRNAALGRISTAEEEDFLLQRGAGAEAFRCERCQAPGPIHYRVCSNVEPKWQLVCPQCWPLLREQHGYRYGGTRKANRRQRS
jgi:uncharacterized protein (DUF924 family)